MPFRIIRNDITKVATDAIVNTANPHVAIGTGTDSAIYEAAGREQLLAEREKIGRIYPGQAAVTPAFGLDAKYIIHTVGPAWHGGGRGEFAVLASCYRESLLLANRLGCGSIAFPLISTGVYGFPKDKALEIAMKTCREFLSVSEMDITLVVFDKTAVDLSEALVEDVRHYIDENYVGRKHEEEYRGLTDARRAQRMSRSLWDEGEETGASIDMSRTMGLPELDDMFVGEAPEVAGEEDVLEGDAALEPEFEADMTFGSLLSGDFDAAPERSEPPSQSQKASGRFAPQAPVPKTSNRFAPQAPALDSSFAPDLNRTYQKRTIAGQDSLEDILKNLGMTFQQRLLQLIDTKGLTDSQVYKNANLDRRLFSKIRCNENYKPSKETAMALAIGLHLNLDDTTDLLNRAGLALSQSSLTDVIVKYCITHEIFDIDKVNALLFSYDLQTLN